MNDHEKGAKNLWWKGVNVGGERLSEEWIKNCFSKNGSWGGSELWTAEAPHLRVTFLSINSNRDLQKIRRTRLLRNSGNCQVGGVGGGGGGNGEASPYRRKKRGERRVDAIIRKSTNKGGLGKTKKINEKLMTEKEWELNIGLSHSAHNKEDPRKSLKNITSEGK